MYRILISLAIAQQLRVEGSPTTKGCTPDAKLFTVEISAGSPEPTKQCCSDGKPGHVWKCRTETPYSNSRSVRGEGKLFDKDHPIPAEAKTVKCKCDTFWSDKSNVVYAKTNSRASNTIWPQ